MPAGFKYSAIAAEKAILTNPLLEKHLLDLAEKAAQFAKETAPVETGEFRDSIEAELAHSKEHPVYARVVAKDYKALWIEKGTVRTPAHNTLENALHRLGGV